jgi:hypothetical protein
MVSISSGLEIAGMHTAISKAGVQRDMIFDFLESVAMPSEKSLQKPRKSLSKQMSRRCRICCCELRRMRVEFA